MYLFFDTETTGLPRNWKAAVTDLNNWPRLVQLAWLIYDNDGNFLGNKDFIIKPIGFKIPMNVTALHGITNEKAFNEGMDLIDVLNEFAELVKQADYLVAHNMDFDEKIVGAEFLRMKMFNILPSKKRFCTMKSSTDFCAINVPYGYKWPKLPELYKKLFDEIIEDYHNAAMDIKATARCFWEMRKRGMI
jgi:DNA polymerase-3 subunit epsilon